MVLHNHQANPHVHISVRAESMHGRRLNPRKADLQRWRETFAEKLRGYGVEAEATRQATRGQSRRPDELWRLKAKDDGRLRKPLPSGMTGANARASRSESLDAWMQIGQVLNKTGETKDVKLAISIAAFIQEATTTWATSRADKDVGRGSQRSSALIDPQMLR
jgi:type IV secretory pathway VirD2 relaxase